MTIGRVFDEIDLLIVPDKKWKMMMDDSFSSYLLSKQSVDDRALNRVVYQTLQTAVAVYAETVPVLRIVEVGAGIGTMLDRLLRWKLFPFNVEYTLVDEMAENISFAKVWLPQRIAERGFQVDVLDETILISDEQTMIKIRFVCSDVFDFIAITTETYDLLIANAFLDLLPMPVGISKLLSLIKADGLAWLTINFDGVTIFEPLVDVELDKKIENLYHKTMDERITGGESKSGRHLFQHFRDVNAEIVSAGASDWVIYPIGKQYPADEAKFLKYILHFFEMSLSDHPQLKNSLLQDWLNARREQVNRGELVYIAHQMDFLVKNQRFV